MLKSAYTHDRLEAGCDEAGRGCLAGPVVAAAVILPKHYQHKVLTDSKQLTLKQRQSVKLDIERDALAWAVAEVDSKEIDQTNILQASFRAMHLALDRLALAPDLLLIDGNRFLPYRNITHHCIVKGDAAYLSIAAASVLAKTYRDELMLKLSDQFPGYGWETNKGYPTRLHRAGIRRLGITPYHRKTFQLLPAQLEIFTKAETR